MDTENSTMGLAALFAMNDGFRDAAILQFAHHAGLFDILVEERTAAEIARTKGWIPRKTEIVLDTLATLNLLAKQDDRYRNTPCVNRFLHSESPDFVGDVLEHSRLQWHLWSRISDVLRTNAPLDEQQELRLRTDPYASEVFNRAMRQLACGIIPEVRVDPAFDGRKHVIDLAGGHGYYLTQLAMHNPQLTGEVWDFESTRPFTEAVFAAKGLADRLRFVSRDIRDGESFRGEADVVMLNDCLHYLAPQEVRDVLRRAAGLLGPDGRLLVITPHLNSCKTSPKAQAVFSFYMMVNTANGGVHSTDFIASVIKELFSRVTVRIVGNLEDSALIVGTERRT